MAVEKTVVSGVWSACTSAGMVCQRLDAGLCALSRFGSWLRSLPVVGASTSEPSGTEVWGLLDLGAAQVRLVLCVGDVPVLVRCFDTGGERWVTRLSETLGLSPAAAEIHLRDHGISTKGSGRSTTEEPGRGVRGGAGDVGEAAVASEQLGGIIRNILGEELDGLCGEIERSYRYALQCHPGAEPSELILVGGGAELRNLDGYLQDRLGIEVNAAGRRLERTELGEERGVETAFIPRAAAGKRYPLSVIAGAIGLAIPPGVNLRGGVETGAVRKKVVAVS
ncbi:MAG: hypothetical protein GY842_12885 [bacterium]|nr:hypothetical protein [bacterium]